MGTEDRVENVDEEKRILLGKMLKIPVQDVGWNRRFGQCKALHRFLNLVMVS
jgi:hypothetical protein